jgi:polyhydroxybutyrate depolymerase
VFGGDRPVNLQIPAFSDGQLYPLVLILHGYGANGFVQQAYFGLEDIVERGDAFALAPDGLVDSGGRQFWNADDACCDFDNKNPDDVAYLGGILDDVMDAWPIDPAQVRVIGHSNGGYMAYRLACDRADVVTSIVALAGNAVSVPCTPAEPVHVLHVHGTADATVPFAGATPSVDQWTTHNGCSGARSDEGTLDLDSAVDGAETQISTTAGCPAGGAVELWTMNGSGHIPNLISPFDTNVSQWWAEHPRGP